MLPDLVDNLSKVGLFYTHMNKTKRKTMKAFYVVSEVLNSPKIPITAALIQQKIPMKGLLDIFKRSREVTSRQTSKITKISIKDIDGNVKKALAAIVKIANHFKSKYGTDIKKSQWFDYYYYNPKEEQIFVNIGRAFPYDRMSVLVIQTFLRYYNDPAKNKWETEFHDTFILERVYIDQSREDLEEGETPW